MKLVRLAPAWNNVSANDHYVWINVEISASGNTKQIMRGYQKT